MKAKLGIGHWFGCIGLALLCFFTMNTYAMAATILLENIDSGNYRWLDVANQAYSADYREGEDSYNYTQASVEVTYETTGTTLHGTMVATNLKPNFAYQLKLAGFPGTPANERIGLAGRWWQDQWDGTKWTGAVSYTHLTLPTILLV